MARACVLGRRMVGSGGTGFTPAHRRILPQSVRKMTQRPRGRPPKQVDPDASRAARLGAAIRTRRQAKKLTLEALAAEIGFSPQHLSQAELAKATVSIDITFSNRTIAGML